MATNDGKVNRIYSNFRGVDFRGEEINLVRSPDSLNMWKDYKETESIRTRPGLKLNKSFTDAIYGIFFYCGEMIVHSGTKLYKVVDGIKTEIVQLRFSFLLFGEWSCVYHFRFPVITFVGFTNLLFDIIFIPPLS